MFLRTVFAWIKYINIRSLAKDVSVIRDDICFVDSLSAKYELVKLCKCLS